MYYIVPNINKLEFENVAQTKFVSISTNGFASIKSKPDFVEVELTSTSFTANSLTDGRTNTDVIRAYEFTPNAANSAANYQYLSFNVMWYLPAQTELKTMIDSGYFGIFPFASPLYWSSTEDTADNAFAVSNTGVISTQSKSNLYCVRPITKLTYSSISSPYSLGQDIGYGIVFDIDTLAKEILVGSKEDICSEIWGDREGNANALFTNGANISVLINDRYEELQGGLILELQEDPTKTATIAIIQAPSDEDSQSIFLKDIIDNIMIEACNEDSYLQNITEFHALLLAKRILQDLNYDVPKEARFYEATITASNKIIPPIDFVDYIRLSIVCQDGILRPLFVNNRINTSFKYLKDQEGSIIVDQLGYPIKAEGTRRSEDNSNSSKSYCICDSKNYCCASRGSTSVYHYPGFMGGQQSYTGSYKWNPETKDFILDSIPSDITTVVLEYVSDPILAEKDPRKLRIHKYLQSTIETGIYHRYIDKMRNIPRVEKEAARREYYNERRKAAVRIHGKANEIRQKLNASIGGTKLNNIF